MRRGRSARSGDLHMGTSWSRPCKPLSSRRMRRPGGSHFPTSIRSSRPIRNIDRAPFWEIAALQS